MKEQSVISEKVKVDERKFLRRIAWFEAWIKRSLLETDREITRLRKKSQFNERAIKILLEL